MGSDVEDARDWANGEMSLSACRVLTRLRLQARREYYAWSEARKVGHSRPPLTPPWRLHNSS